MTRIDPPPMISY